MTYPRWITLLAILATLAPLTAHAQTPEQRYFDWAAPTFPAREYQARRLHLMEALAQAGSGVFLVPSSDGLTHGGRYVFARAAYLAIPDGEERYMHVPSYFGHHLGLSSGDPSLLDEPLAPGMVFTVEPWYYNHDLAISVFVEDVLLVTPGGVEVLTRSLPRSPEDLERMVR